MDAYVNVDTSWGAEAVVVLSDKADRFVRAMSSRRVQVACCVSWSSSQAFGICSSLASKLSNWGAEKQFFMDTALGTSLIMIHLYTTVLV